MLHHMTRVALKWRLKGGYSQFLDGSQVELACRERSFAAALQMYPMTLARRHQPVEVEFRMGRSYSGEAAPGIRWRIGPEARVRALLLFEGNAFLGNFRVPKGHFAVQWDLEARAEAGLNQKDLPALIGFSAGTRLYQSWVRVFGDNRTFRSALQTAWEEYKNPFSATDIHSMVDGEVIRWRFEGHAQLAVDFNWGVGTGWALPGDLPLVDVEKRIGAIAGAGARFLLRQEGEFSLQLRKQGPQIKLHLRRSRTARRKLSASLGVQVLRPVEVKHIGWTEPKAAKAISRTLGQPLVGQLDRACEKALDRRLSLALSIAREGWKKRGTLLDATWKAPALEDFQPSYCELLKARIPDSSPGLRVTGKLENIRGRRVSLDFCWLNWLRLRNQTERESQEVISVGPSGEVVVEQTESLEKHSYRWDEIQFLRLVHRQITGSKGPVEADLWTWGTDDEMSEDALRGVLRMALHAGIIKQFALPGKSAFPLRVRVVLGSLFSEQGLGEVRLASRADKWKALVRSLELAEPEKYRRKSFWRDWIDSPELRSGIDNDPVGSPLLTRYPVPDRTDNQRMLVVAAYRRAKRFLTLLEHWKRGESRFVLQTFELGMDLPIFIFFHLLCPLELRSSAGIMTGGLEESWGDPGIFGKKLPALQ
jgi:hypothetical protein